MWITQKTTCQFGRRAQLRAENLSILPSVDPYADLMHCSFRFTNLPDFALDRLSRYEATLWRQAGQVLFALDALDRRKPQERRCRFPR
jgi:hypothetical protein